MFLLNQKEMLFVIFVQYHAQDIAVIGDPSSIIRIIGECTIIFQDMHIVLIIYGFLYQKIID